MSRWRDFPKDEDSITPLKTAINSIATRLGAATTSEIAVVFGVWDDAVGAQIAAHAKPSAIKHGVLVVEVDDNRWATQLKWMTAQVTEQLNSALGHDAINGLEIKFRPRNK